MASRLKGDNGISIVIDGDTIIINGGEGFSNIVCVGGGACILSSNILPIIELKTIVAGTGITISDTATELTIAASGNPIITSNIVTGNGTLLNPVTIRNGTSCNDIPQWDNDNITWRIFQPPSATTTTVGPVASAMFTSVTAAFADGCTFVRIVAGVASESSITLPGPGNYIIYIDPGATYTLTAATTIFTGSNLTIMGGGLSSVLQWNPGAAGISAFSSASNVDEFRMSWISFQNLATVDGALLVNTVPRVRIDHTQVILPNAGFGFIGASAVTVLTRLDLNFVDIVGSGMLSTTALQGGPGSVVQANELEFSGIYVNGGVVVNLTGANVAINGINVVPLLNPIAMILDGIVSNVIGGNSLDITLPNTTGTNFIVRNCSLTGLNKISNLLAGLTLFLGASASTSLVNVQCNILDTTAIGSSLYDIENLQVFASYIPVSTINLGVSSRWHNVTLFSGGLLTLTGFAARTTCDTWNLPNTATLVVDILVADSNFLNFSLPGGGAGATCTLGGFRNSFQNFSEFLMLTLSPSPISTSNNHCFAQNFNGGSLTLDPVALGGGQLNVPVKLSDVTLTGSFIITANASESMVSNVTCTTIVTPALGTGLSNFKLSCLRQYSSIATQTISVDNDSQWTDLRFRGDVIFDMYTANISNITCSSSIRFITTKSNEGRSSVVSGVVRQEDGLPSTPVEFGTATQSCQVVSFSDIDVRVGTVTINNCSNCVFNNVTQRGSAGSFTIANVPSGLFPGGINVQRCRFEHIEHNGSALAIGSAAVNGANIGGPVTQCVFNSFVIAGVNIVNTSQCTFSDFWVEQQVTIIQPVTVPVTPICTKLQLCNWDLFGVVTNSSFLCEDSTFCNLIFRIFFTTAGARQLWNGILQNNPGGSVGIITVASTESTFSDWNIQTEPITISGNNQTWTNIKQVSTASTITISGNNNAWNGGYTLSPVIVSGNFNTFNGIVYANAASDLLISGTHNTINNVKVAVTNRNINVTGGNNLITGCSVGIAGAGTGTINGAAGVGTEPLVIGNFTDSALTGTFNAASTGNAIF